MASRIEWLARPGTTPESWNPLQDARKGESGRGYHCTKVSPGCEHCWAEAMNKRFGNGLPFDNAPTDFELVGMDKPLRWRKPRTVAVQLMSDIFHEEVSFVQIADIFDLMAQTSKHTYIVLTKRQGRMLAFLDAHLEFTGVPLPDNIWGMVTAENQEQADERIADLRKAPFAVLGASIEPMLEEIDVSAYLSRHCNFCGGTLEDHRGERRCSRPYWGITMERPGLDWVIVGGESGPGARPMNPDWARKVRDDCQAAGVAFFYKQAIINGKRISCPELDGKQWKEFPDVQRLSL